MRQAMGQTFQFYFIVIFFTVTFVFMIAFISYMKAFRLNSGIAKAIEIHEGYNDLAKDDIVRVLSGYGYRVEGWTAPTCPQKKGQTAIGGVSPYQSGQRVCVYELPKNSNGYFRYGIQTYMYMDVPIIRRRIALPVYSETEKIYEFNV